MRPMRRGGKNAIGGKGAHTLVLLAVPPSVPLLQPLAHFFHVAAVIRDTMVVIGGHTERENFTNHLFFYQLNCNTWILPNSTGKKLLRPEHLCGGGMNLHIGHRVSWPWADLAVSRVRYFLPPPCPLLFCLFSATLFLLPFQPKPWSASPSWSPLPTPWLPLEAASTSRGASMEWRWGAWRPCLCPPTPASSSSAWKPATSPGPAVSGAEPAVSPPTLLRGVGRKGEGLWLRGARVCVCELG